MQHNIDKKEGNTYKVNVTFTASEVDEVFKMVLHEMSKNVKLDGFREGKAPADMVKGKINQTTLRSEALNAILGKSINEIIRDNRLKPVTGPTIDIKQFDEGKDAEFEVTIIEKPEIKLNDYEEEIKKIEHSIQNKTEEATKEHKHDHEHDHEHDHSHTHGPQADWEIVNKKIIDKIVEICDVGLSKDLIELERNRMMSSLFDQVEKVGLTIDQYLTSIKKTADQLKEDYEKIAKNTLKADFLLHEIANVKNIKVSDEEVQQMIDVMPDQKSKEMLSRPEQRNYIKSVLTKTKILEDLRKLVKIVEKQESKNIKEEK